MIRSVSGINSLFHCAYTHGNIYFSELIKRPFRPGFSPRRKVQEFTRG
jgi:hypothetical protein